MKLSNSPRPKQQLVFELERKKSYAFRVLLRELTGVPMDITGCTIRFVMKRDEYDHDPFDATFPTVNLTAEITDPLNGEAAVTIQAAELDGDPGTYYYSLVLWTPEKYSLILAKGKVELLPNTDSFSAQHQFLSTTPEDSVEIRMRGQDVASITPSALSPMVIEKARVEAVDSAASALASETAAASSASSASASQTSAANSASAAAASASDAATSATQAASSASGAASSATSAASSATDAGNSAVAAADSASTATAARDATLAASTIVGAGRPDIPATMTPEVADLVAAATSGAFFRSTDGPQGAWEWQKRGTAWVVTLGDTGWRSIVTMLTDLDTTAPVSSASYASLRRVGNSCTLAVRRPVSGSKVGTPRATNALILFSAPTGFVPDISYGTRGSGRLGTALATIETLTAQGRIELMAYGSAGTIADGELVIGRAAWETAHNWPTTLPGTPA